MQLVAPLMLVSQLASATPLYVSSYSSGNWAGNISILEFGPKPAGGGYALRQTGALNTSTNSPSWLTLDKASNTLFLVDEAIGGSPNGTLVAYDVKSGGNLEETARVKALQGGVSAVVFGNGSAVAVAHYGASALQTYRRAKGKLELLQSFDFKRQGWGFETGKIAQRQEAPHPHQVLLDPSGRFLLVPDLGFDQVHVFYVEGNGLLSPLAPLKTPKGTGPRHGVFSPGPMGNGDYMFYLVGELAGDVAGYVVSHRSEREIAFYEVGRWDTLPEGRERLVGPDGASLVAPAEIAITTNTLGQSNLIVSNRNDASFGRNPSVDSLMTYAILPSGLLVKQPLQRAGGSFPRSFAVSADGVFMAVALQKSGAVVVLKRNGWSDLFDEEVARVKMRMGAEQATCVVWGV
ncbi:putative isomerase YbhE [Trichodelitschia bisporula]|uniref:Putative isomerase YbhE n=1 Tax=Trichodelitschia bisporula TaxID=703511 RepID=A0A6G1I7S2_9PEZI|nr:putative isomerase YbhE [Trichodelitschia bisporula]